MRLFSNLPDTCSSEIESWLLVAICHSDYRIKLADIRARMPKTRTKNGMAVPLYGLNNISMKMSRFRKQAAIGPRTERAGSKELKAAYQEMLPEQCLSANSTKAISGLLTSEQRKDVEETNKGKFPQKGRAEKRTQGLQNPETARKRKFEGTTVASGAETKDAQAGPAKRVRIELQALESPNLIGNHSNVGPRVSSRSFNAGRDQTTDYYPTVEQGTSLHEYNQPNNSATSFEYPGYYRQGIQQEQNGVYHHEEERQAVDPHGYNHYGRIDPRHNLCEDLGAADRDGHHVIAFGTDDDMPGHFRARDSESYWGGLMNSTTQDGNPQTPPDYSLDPTEPQAEVETEMFYPDPEELTYGPYGSLSNKYRFV